MTLRRATVAILGCGSVGRRSPSLWRKQGSAGSS